MKEVKIFLFIRSRNNEDVNWQFASGCNLSAYFSIFIAGRFGYLCISVLDDFSSNHIRYRICGRRVMAISVTTGDIDIDVYDE